MASLKAWISGFSTVLTSLAYAVVLPLTLSAPVVNPELEKLVNQVHNDITSYLSVTSLTEIFSKLAQLMRSDDGIVEMAHMAFNITRDSLTQEQREECWNSISTALNKFGGPEHMKKVLMKGLNAFKNLISEPLQKDREDFAKMAASGKTDEEVLTEVYKKMQSYWNITYGQKVIDTIKRSMKPEEWKIATEDSSKYMKTSNFDMSY